MTRLAASFNSNFEKHQLATHGTIRAVAIRLSLKEHKIKGVESSTPLTASAQYLLVAR